MDQRFGKHERLTARADFTRCYRHGLRLRTAYFTVYAYRQGKGGTRLGIAVGKVVGTAVVRNRVKRRLREIFRRQKYIMAHGYDLFVRAIPASADVSYPQLERAWHEVAGELKRRTTWHTNGEPEATRQ